MKGSPWARHLLVLGLTAIGGLRPLAAQSGILAMSRVPNETRVASLLRVTQDSLVADAERTWRASPAVLLPGWGESLRDVERIVGRPWRGLPPAVLLVPDDGQGFNCDFNRCLGRFLGARIEIRDQDSTTVTIASIILIAESAMMRRDVWEHELTHAVLGQYGMIEESRRHDPRYFRRDRTTFVAHD